MPPNSMYHQRLKYSSQTVCRGFSQDARSLLEGILGGSAHDLSQPGRPVRLRRRPASPQPKLHQISSRSKRRLCRHFPHRAVGCVGNLCIATLAESCNPRCMRRSRISVPTSPNQSPAVPRGREASRLVGRWSLCAPTGDRGASICVDLLLIPLLPSSDPIVSHFDPEKRGEVKTTVKADLDMWNRSSLSTIPSSMHDRYIGDRLAWPSQIYSSCPLDSREGSNRPCMQGSRSEDANRS